MNKVIRVDASNAQYHSSVEKLEKLLNEGYKILRVDSPNILAHPTGITSEHNLWVLIYILHKE